MMEGGHVTGDIVGLCGRIGIGQIEDLSYEMLKTKLFRLEFIHKQISLVCNLKLNLKPIKL